ncbi:hypothetical protein VTL71DRAFT_5182 [Oculimacula yallundae]|uniref:Uncharacterized protein n=1 Tax=Oculimacula yallundae TaxID=86028 RepID=A0ABR4C1D3_9HELO
MALWDRRGLGRPMESDQVCVRNATRGPKALQVLLLKAGPMKPGNRIVNGMNQQVIARRIQTAIGRGHRTVTSHRIGEPCKSRVVFTCSSQSLEGFSTALSLTKSDYLSS